MLVAASKLIEDLIVHYLSQSRAMSAAQLQEAITAEHRSVSIQAIYKELRKLIVDGVVWKHKNGYSLSASWVLNLSELADNMYSTMSESGLSEDVLPADGEKTIFRFSSLRRLDDFWINSLIMMIRESPGKKMYQWLPHPWFNLSHNYKSLPFQNALRITGGTVQSIIGGNTYLDKRAEILTTKGVYEFHYAPGPFDHQQNTYYSATDCYLQTVKLDPPKVSALEELYKSTSSAKNFDARNASEVINVPCTAVLTIETNTRRSKSQFKKLRNYFEV